MQARAAQQAATDSAAALAEEKLHRQKAVQAAVASEQNRTAEAICRAEANAKAEAESAAAARLQAQQNAKKEQELRHSVATLQQRFKEVMASAQSMQEVVRRDVERRVAVALERRGRVLEQSVLDVAASANAMKSRAVAAEKRLELESASRLRLTEGTKTTSSALASSVEQLSALAHSLQRVRCERDDAIRRMRELKAQVAAVSHENENNQNTLTPMHPTGSDFAPLQLCGNNIGHNNPLMMDDDQLYEVRVPYRVILHLFFCTTDNTLPTGVFCVEAIFERVLMGV